MLATARMATSRAALALLLVLAVAGCSGDDVASGAAEVTAPLSDATALATYTTQLQADDALSGTLEVSNGCVYIRTGEDLVLPAWPAGKTAFTESSVSFDGTTWKVGDQVSVTGSTQVDALVPDACDPGAGVFGVAAPAAS